MSTLTEIEAAVATLPQAEKEQLHAHLTEELTRKPASEDYAEWLANFRALQKSLNLDERKVQEWKAAIRDARR